MITQAQLTDDYVKNTCRIGQGHSCCRYLTMSATGWGCEKHTDLAHHLDARVAHGEMTARGNNCEGVTPDA